MSFEPIAPPDVKTTTAAPVKASIKVRHGEPIVWLSITEAGQQKMFGRSIRGVRLKIRRGTGDRDGQLELTIAAKGSHEVRNGIKDSARIAVGTWPGVPRLKMTARPCTIMRADPDNMIAVIKLPEFVGEPV